MKRTLFDRLIAKLDVRGPYDCWIWKGAVSGGGYAQISDKGVMRGMHRVSWSLHNKKPVPKGKPVLHSCDTPLCGNPRHLTLGTHRKNVAQMIARGRHTRGITHGMVKLTETEVRAIRADPRSLRAIGRDYALAFGQIGAIKNRKSWKHIY